MKITIIAVGKMKERYFADAAAEYLSRIKNYAETEIIELADESVRDKPSTSEIEIAKNKEGERIKQRLTNISNAALIALTPDGQQFSSESLAVFMQTQADNARRLVFIIGGTHGISNEILSMCHTKLSFSKMTFPHRLFRVMLLEQVFRACKINRNEPYHK